MIYLLEGTEDVHEEHVVHDAIPSTSSTEVFVSQQDEVAGHGIGNIPILHFFEESRNWDV